MSARIAAAKAYDALWTGPTNVAPPTNAVETLRREVERLATSVASARALADHPKGGRRLAFKKSPLDMSMRTVESARSIAKLLAADAVLQALDGRGDEAMESSRPS